MKDINIRLLVAMIFVTLLFYPKNGKCIRPDHHYSQNPSSLSMTYDSLNIATSNGRRLTGWHCKPQKPQSDIVIILSGQDAGNMSNQLELVQSLVTKTGVSVVLFDYEGFGTSDNIAIDSDLIALPEFASDLRSVIQWVGKNIQPDSNKICLYGRSMGASLALTVASIYGGVGGIIAESPYTSQSSLTTACFKRNKDRPTHFISSKLLEPSQIVQNCMASLLLIHGQDEDLITSDEIYSLWQQCASKQKSLWIASGCSHLDVPYKEMGTFLNATFELLSNLGK